MLQAQKLSCLPSDVVLIRLQATIVFQKSLSSITQSMLLKRFLILHPILTKSIHHSFSKKCLMTAEDLTNIGTQKGTQLASLSCSLSLTLVCLLFQVPLHYQF